MVDRSCRPLTVNAVVYPASCENRCRVLVSVYLPSNGWPTLDSATLAPARSKPTIPFISVLFPDPLGPTIAVSEPRAKAPLR